MRRRVAALAAVVVLAAAGPARADTFFSIPEVSAVGDLDGDGVGDLIALLPLESPVLALSGRTGEQLWRVEVPTMGRAYPLDLGGGVPGVLLVSGTDAFVATVVTATGATVWHREWPGARQYAIDAFVPGGGDDVVVVVTATNGGPVALSAPPRMEVVDGATGVTRGTIAPARSLGSGPPTLLGDLDGDGGSDVGWWSAPLLGTAALRAYRYDGSVIWERPAPSSVGAMPVGDVTGDGRPDATVVVDSETWLLNGADGRVLWARPSGTGWPGGDVDGDGVGDVVLSTADGIAAYDAAGTQLYQRALAYRGLRQAGDVDGDGARDFLAGLGANGTSEALVDGRTGTVVRTGPELPLNVSVDGRNADTGYLVVADGVATVGAVDGQTGRRLWTTTVVAYRTPVRLKPLLASAGRGRDVAIVSIEPDGYRITVVGPSGAVRWSRYLVTPY